MSSGVRVVGSTGGETAPGELDHSVEVLDLRTADDSGLIATGMAAPRLSWRLAAVRRDVRQIGYEIELSADATFTTDVQTSGFVACSSPLHRPWPGVLLRSREVRWWRVRVWTQQGRTAWSAPSRIEAGLLEATDWVARPVSSSSARVNHGPAAVMLVRRAFRLEQPVVRARLYVTALGVHETRVNGHMISEDLLEPGWTAYTKRLLYAAYDVTDHLVQGENVLSATVAEGWWARDTRNVFYDRIYGERTALLAQLEVDFSDGSRCIVATNETWRAGSGAWRSASIYNGVDVDLRCEPLGWHQPAFDDHQWQTTVAMDLPAGLEMRSAPPVRVVQSFLCIPMSTAWGTMLVDTEQNLTGYLRLRLRGQKGSVITVRHAEVLDHEGKLYTEPLNSAKATDRYTLADSNAVILEPSFTYHGFRYAEIAADPGVVIEEVTVLVVASDLKPTGSFECSDVRINKLFENVRWSQRGNFLSLPTDCPQRDERLGWTGDIQVFAQTSCMNADARAFLASWLVDLAKEQRATGYVPSIVPDNAPNWEEEQRGGAGWGDAATLVPWALYEAYGDEEVLRRQYESMRAWVDWCASRRDSSGTWSGDPQFGDWLDPNAAPDAPQKATTDSDYIASSFLSFSASILARSAAVLGQERDALTYRQLSADAAAATWRRWRTHAISTQTGCAIALELGIAPSEERAQVADRLAQLVEANEGKIGTGFLGTPLLLPALAKAGKVDAAYRLLLNTQCPGWLYPVLQGATTMWERWDAIRPDGTIHSGSIGGFVADAPPMLSFNHYAFGAVAAWLYRSVAGLSPLDSDPGYRTVIFAPLPGGGLTFARARVESPYGPVSIAWKLDPSSLNVDIEVPPGASAWLIPPDSWRVTSAQHSLIVDSTPERVSRRGYPLTSGRHSFLLKRHEIADSDQH
jgi:alpha-L-rhamnosidase